MSCRMTTSPPDSSSMARIWNDCSGNLILSPFLQSCPDRRLTSKDSKRARYGDWTASLTEMDPQLQVQPALNGSLVEPAGIFRAKEV